MRVIGGTELRIYREWKWVSISDGRLGGGIHYELRYKDELQYRIIGCSDDWGPVPIEENEKPKHPNDIKREQDIKDLNSSLDKLIESGVIKL